MPPEREIIQHGINYTDPTFWLFLVLTVAGTVGQILVSDEPFKLRRFLGEIILGIVGAIMLYAGGLLQGLTSTQLVVLGGMAGLGGVRLFEWGIKIFRKMREVM